MAEPTFYVALSGAFVGGCIGGIAAYLVQRWRYNIDRWTEISDELCKEVIALADLSAEFWLSSRTSASSSEMALKEMRIKGSVARIDALKGPFEDWCSRGALTRFKDGHGELVDAATGGQFTALKRDKDANAAYRVQEAAAELVSSIRYGLRHSVGIRAWCDRQFRKD